MSSNRYLFTSESVSMGHPDKVADQISDAILDHCLRPTRMSRVACETMVTTDLAIVVRRDHHQRRPVAPTVDGIVRDMIREIGYVDPTIGFAADTCQVHVPSAQAVAAHRHGRGYRRGGRSGHDVRLRLPRKPRR